MATQPEFHPVAASGRLKSDSEERDDDFHAVLLNLSEQVSQISEQLARLGVPPSQGGFDNSFLFETHRRRFGQSHKSDGGEPLIRRARPPLPDPRLLRRILRQRQLRARFFHGDLFADPAWDILLDLTAARAEHKRISITSLCIASGVPPTTALRWINQMTDEGLLERAEDDRDRRRTFIRLSDGAADAMARLFIELQSGPTSVWSDGLL